jgi:hypothetical protein
VTTLAELANIQQSLSKPSLLFDPGAQDLADAAAADKATVDAARLAESQTNNAYNRAKTAEQILINKQQEIKLTAENQAKRDLATQARLDVSKWVGDGTGPGGIWGGLDQAVAAENARRNGLLQIGMTPQEEFAFRRVALAPALKELNDRAAKDPTYQNILTRFSSSPEYLAFAAAKEPEKEGILASVLSGATRVVAGAPSLLGGTAAIGGAIANTLGATDTSNTLYNVATTLNDAGQAIRDKGLSQKGKLEDQLLGQTKGFGDTAGLLLRNPGMLANVVGDSLAGGLGAGVVARGILATTGGIAGRTAAEIALATKVGSAIAGGVSSASDSADAAAKAGLTGDARAGATALATLVGGGISGLLGASASEKALARVVGVSEKKAVDALSNAGVAATAKNIVQGTAKNVISEGIEEGIQSAAGEAAVKGVKGDWSLSNWWDAKGATLGAAAGGVLGGLHNVTSGGGAAPAPTPAPPGSGVVDPATGTADPTRPVPPAPPTVDLQPLHTAAQNAVATLLDTELGGGSTRTYAQQFRAVVGAAVAKNSSLHNNATAAYTDLLGQFTNEVKNNYEVNAILQALPDAERPAALEAMMTRLNNNMVMPAAEGLGRWRDALNTAVSAKGLQAQFNSAVSAETVQRIKDNTSPIDSALTGEQGLREFLDWRMRTALNSGGTRVSFNLLTSSADKEVKALAKDLSNLTGVEEDVKRFLALKVRPDPAVVPAPAAPAVAPAPTTNTAPVNNLPVPPVNPAPAPTAPTAPVAPFALDQATPYLNEQKTRLLQDPALRAAVQESLATKAAATADAIATREAAINTAVENIVNTWTPKRGAAKISTAVATDPALDALNLTPAEFEATVGRVEGLYALKQGQPTAAPTAAPEVAAPAKKSQAASASPTRNNQRLGPPSSPDSFTAIGEAIQPAENAVEVLAAVNDIAQGDPGLARFAAVVQPILAKAQIAGITPRLDDLHPGSSSDTLGGYVSESGNVQVRMDAASIDKLTTLTHEITHALTEAAITDGLTATGKPENKALVAQLEGLRAETKAALETKHYGHADVHEFVAEVWANPDFAVAMDMVGDAAKGSLLTRFVRTIKSWLGIKPEGFGESLTEYLTGSYNGESLSSFIKRVSEPLFTGAVSGNNNVYNRMSIATATQGVQTLVTEAGKRVAAGDTAFDVRQVIAAPGSIRLSVLADALRAPGEKVMSLFRQGLMTFDGLHKIMDSGPTALLRGATGPIKESLQRMSGRQQELLTRTTAVMQQLGKLGFDSERRTLAAYSALTLADKGSGHDPRTAPQSPEAVAVQAQFDALNKNEQAALLHIADTAKEYHDTFYAALIKAMEQVANSNDPKVKGNLEVIKQAIDRRVKFYGPLSREGQYYVRVTGVDGNTLFYTQSNSKLKLDDMRAWLQQQHPDAQVSQVGLVPTVDKTGGLTNRDGGAFRDSLLDAIEHMGDTIPAALKEQLVDTVFDTYYKQSASDLEKYRIQRQGVAGGEVTRPGLGKYFNVLSFATAQAEFTPHLREQMTEAGRIANENGLNAQALLDTVRMHVNLALSPHKTGDITSTYLNASHMYAMAFTPAVAIINMVSLVTNTLPYLNAAVSRGRGFGGEALTDMGRAMRDTFSQGWKLAGNQQDGSALTGRDAELFRLHDYMMDHGRLHKDAMRSAIDEISTNPLMARIKDFGSFFQNRSEQLQVGTAAIAAYDTSLKINQGFTEEQHFKWALEAVDETLPTSAQYNKPILAKAGDIGKIVYMLKAYPIAVVNMMANDIKEIATLKGEARRIALNRFIGANAIHVLVGGAAATPISLALAALANAAGGEDDPALEKLTVAQRLAVAARESQGNAFADWVDGGVVPGINIGPSTHINPLVMFRTPQDGVFSAKGIQDIGLQMLGPLANTVNRAASGTSVTEDWRSAQAWSPRALQGSIQVMDWMNKDMKDINKRGEYVADVGYGDAALRVLGFQPRAIVEARAPGNQLASIEYKFKEEERFVLQAAALAKNQGLPAPDVLAEHNREYAKYPKFLVTPEAIDKKAAELKALGDENAVPDASRAKRSGLDRSILGFR